MIFSSTVTAKALIDEAISELGLFKEPARATLYRLFNECLTRLYTEVICHRECLEMTCTAGTLTYSDLKTKLGQSISAEDICDIAVKSPFNPILRATAWTQKLLPSNTACYVCDKNRITFYPSTRQTYLIFYIYHPLPVTADTESTATVALPEEYHSLLRAKLRGEAYKLANEDELAAKWLGEYNLLLEDFCRYVARKKEALSE